MVDERDTRPAARASHATVMEALVEYSQDQLVFLDRDFNFLRVNRAYAVTCRKAPEEFVGRNHFELYPHAENQAIFERVRDTGEPAVWKEKPFTFRDQPERGVTYWDWTLTPVKDDTGFVAGLVFSLRDVTATVRARQQIEERERELRAFFDNISVGAVQLRPDGRFLRVNDRYCEIVGYTGEELLAGMTPHQLTHPEDQARDREFMVGVLEGRQRPAGIEKRVVRKDGHVIWVFVTSNVVRDSDGRIVRLAAIVEDITERKRVEGKLRASEERLSLALAASGVGLWDWDLTADVAHLSPEYLRLLGSSRADVHPAAAFFRGRVHPDDLPAVDRTIGEHLRGESQRSIIEYRMRRDSGDYLWLRGIGQVTARDGSGAPLRMVGVVSDVSQSKHVEEQLRRAAAELAEAQEVAKLGSWKLDVATKTVTWSRELYRVFDVDEAEFGASYDAFLSRVHPDDRPLVLETNRAAIAEGAAFAIEYRITTRSGELRWIREVGRATTDSGGLAVGLVGTAQDITSRKNADEALLRANEQLQADDRRKNEFMAMLSHELRNPLAPIRNSLYVLGRAAPGGEQARRAQAVIERQVAQLTRLIDDLLDVTRITRGKAQLQREILDLNELTYRTVEDHRAEFVNAGVDLELIAATAEVWVNGDRARLSQAIGNLLQNATKFTPCGGKATVSVEGVAAQRQAIVRVRDTGRGIASEVRPRLFEPFTQADVTIDRKKGGLGLGLALVKGLVEMHGGFVAAASPGVGRGATFTITLPLEATGPAEAHRPPTEAGQTGLRVLVIEDNADAADSLREALLLSGHDVEVAYGGPAGIETARTFRPEVVLCDIGLPEMDGYEVARAMRADPDLGRVRLVALTGYAGPEDVAKAKEAGFDAHLAKPPSLDAIERALAGQSGAREHEYHPEM